MAKRTPVRELIRSLARGEEPRGKRRVQEAASFSVHIEVRGEVLSVTETDAVLEVEVVGEWALTDLDADGMPVSSQSGSSTGVIVLERKWSDDVFVGSHIAATSTSSLLGLTSTVARLPER
jgi:hypothetical protein